MTTGPKSYFRPKTRDTICVNLTTDGNLLLQAIQDRTGASRSDIIEYLVRTYGLTVDFSRMERHG